MDEYERLLDALHARIRKSHQVSLKTYIPHPFAVNAPRHLLDAPKVLMFKPKTDAGYRCVYDPFSQSWLNITGPTPTKLRAKHCPTFVNSTPQSSIHLHRACQKSRTVARLVKKYKFGSPHETPVFLLHKWLRGVGDIRHTLHLKLLNGVVHDAVKHILPEIKQIVTDNPTLYAPEVTQAILGLAPTGEADPVGVLSYVVSFAQLERLGIDFATDEFLVRRPPKRACKKIQAQLEFFHNKYTNSINGIGEFIGAGMAEASQNRTFFVNALTQYTAHYNIYREMAGLSGDIQTSIHQALHDIDRTLTRIWMSFLNPKTAYLPSTFNTFGTDLPTVFTATINNRSYTMGGFSENPMSFHDVVGLRFVAWASLVNFEIANRYVNNLRKKLYLKYQPEDGTTSTMFPPKTPAWFVEHILSRFKEWPVNMLSARLDIQAEPTPTRFTELKQVVLAYFKIEAWNTFMNTPEGQLIFVDEQRNLITLVITDMLSISPAENARGYLRLLSGKSFILILKGGVNLFSPLPEKLTLRTLFRSLK